MRNRDIVAQTLNDFDANMGSVSPQTVETIRSALRFKEGQLHNRLDTVAYIWQYVFGFSTKNRIMRYFSCIENHDQVEECLCKRDDWEKNYSRENLDDEFIKEYSSKVQEVVKKVEKAKQRYEYKDKSLSGCA